MRLALLVTLLAAAFAAPAHATSVPSGWHGRQVHRVAPVRPAPKPRPDPAAAAAAPAPGARPSAGEQALLAEINRARAEAGLAPLSVDSRLQSAARAHTANLLDADAFTHDFVKDGAPVGFSTWIRWYYAGSCSGENLASGSPSLSAAEAVQLWLASPGHRANMLSTRFTTIGIALDGRNGSYVATTDFGGC